MQTVSTNVKPSTRYLNWDANGGVYVSKRPMNQEYYATPALLYCIPTKAKRITKKGVFVGAICITIDGEILKIIDIKNRKGWDRVYSNKGLKSI